MQIEPILEEQMQTALGYIATELKDSTNLGWFTKEWSKLSDADKAKIKEWAVAEMKEKGLV